MCSLLLLAATVRSFAHMPLGLSDRNSCNVNHRHIMQLIVNQRQRKIETTATLVLVCTGCH